MYVCMCIFFYVVLTMRFLVGSFEETNRDLSKGDEILKDC